LNDAARVVSIRPSPSAPPLLSLLEDLLEPDADASPNPTPPLLALLETMPDLVLQEILARLDPYDFAVLAQVGGILHIVYRYSPCHPPHNVLVLTTSSTT